MKELWWVIKGIGCCWIPIWSPVIFLLLIKYVKKPYEPTKERGFPMDLPLAEIEPAKKKDEISHG